MALADVVFGYKKFKKANVWN